ncbi:MAG: radical SAM family heme chaperone HemW [Proteobacteria bacterium]|nr:radical SAM family heme chaperone HemW [Pseudomonadota bacterium]MBU1389690.1 radical SAM family heme chaperone HemW [Pseudomonadota bacterium]MBU1542628.1 radical SAM family heme chaperone HemW [Pseudomonadota bacterium]MBU2479544.1 radical SAM family heme chaperone HemW [Pseudomonadota bacterium]
MSDTVSIYIHVPFCIKKCVYCDFYSDTQLSFIPEYLCSLEKEIGLRSKKQTDQRVDTIYFGGGTPSVLTIHQVETLLKTVQKNFSISPDAEITFEVNPGTIDEHYLAALKDIGITRLSLGIQSFNKEKLAFLQRIHSVRQGRDAVEYARKAGFDNISLDLMYGLPFETKELWHMDLTTALQMAPSHLSCYMLTIEPGTPLDEHQQNKKFKPICPDVLWDLFEKTSRTLETSGYEHYEISNFSRGKKNRSAHNSGYWNMKPYMGFGPAAHSYDNDIRSWNIRDVAGYICKLEAEHLPVEETEALTLDQKMLEMIMLRLRTLEGIDLEDFKRRFGITFESRFEQVIDQVCSASMGKIEKGTIEEPRFFLTLEGKTHLNSIVEAFSQRLVE